VSVRETVLKALDDAFSDGIKSLYGAAVANCAGGETMDKAMEQFDRGIVLEVVKLHDRVIAETTAELDKAGIT
jgi:hypothetical protein